jgi:sugar phosphate isomerase/epimerase
MKRTTVCLSLAAAALMGLPLHAADQPDPGGAKKLGWKLTLQAWSVNFWADHGKTAYDAIDAAKQLGVHYLEEFPNQTISADDPGKFGPDMTEAQIKAFLDRAKADNVELIDYGVTGISGKEDEARKLFDWARKMGITTIVSEPEPRDLPAIDKLAGEYGIRVAIHDHPKGSSKYWDPEYTYGLIKDLKNVGFCADVGHWKRSGLDPVVVLQRYGDKVFSLHFKDLVPGENGKDLHDVVWGTGQSHAAEMLAVLAEKGFKGPIAIEYEYKWDIPTLQKCVDFFYEQADKLAAK